MTIDPLYPINQACRIGRARGNDALQTIGGQVA